jgi:glycosyltransferase involved in cell wall biosynthesis
LAQDRIIAWGSYDDSKPRVRLLLDALARRGALAAQIRIAAWQDIEDKSVAGRARLLKVLLRLALSYPLALLRLLRQPRGSTVLLPYPGTPDVFLAAPIARLRGHRLVLDAFLPIHDTIVGDRAMVDAGSWIARAIWAVERMGLRLADVILVDTDQHGDFFASEFGLERDRFVTVLVGAEPLFASPPRNTSLAELPDLPTDRPLVLFYGQLIPLHGLPAILEAIELTRDDPFHWVVVGRGQEEPKLKAALEDRGGGSNATWIPWVDYEVLPSLIARAHVCLGVFGASDKAGRVIPNKVFQALFAGKPVITRSSPAIDALAQRFPNALITVPAEDSAALADAVRRIARERHRGRSLPKPARHELGPDRGVDMLLERLSAS